MYFVKYGESYLYDPRNDIFTIYDMELDLEQNSCGYLDFTIYPDHPKYNSLIERNASVLITVYDDGVLLFSGYIYEIEKQFKNDKHIKCKGELSFLSDSIVRPYSTHIRSYGDKAPDTVDGYFEWLINQHNIQAGGDKSFIVGINEGAILDSNNYIFRESNQYPTTMEEIEDKLLNNLGGYLRVRHEDGKRYIDYLSEWTNTNSQVLDFGVNITDFTKNDDLSETISYIVPLGANLSETQYPYDDGYRLTSDTVRDVEKEYYIHSYTQCKKIAMFESGITYYEKETYVFKTKDIYPIDGITYYIKNGDSYESVEISAFKTGVTYYEQEDQYFKTPDSVPSDQKTYFTFDESYTSAEQAGKFLEFQTYYEYYADFDESAVPLTILNVKEWHPSVFLNDSDYYISGDMIIHKPSVDKYGFIGQKYNDTDITTKNRLLAAGFAALKSMVGVARTIEVRAIDMHMIDPSFKTIRVGEYVRVRSKPNDFDSYMICTKVELNLAEPSRNIYTLGSTYNTLTGDQNRKIRELNSSISSIANKS